MCATVSRDSVHRPTWQPSRAAAYAASTPACPAPMTMTSNACDRQVIFRCRTSRRCAAARPRSCARRRSRRAVRAPPADRQARTPPACRRRGRALRRGDRDRARLLEQRDVARVRDRRRVAQRFVAGQRARDRARADRRSPSPVVAGHVERRLTPSSARPASPSASGRSLLFATTSRRLPAVCVEQLARPRRCSGSLRSRTTRQVGDARAPARRARRLRARRRRRVSRQPAVSTSVTARPSMSTRSVTRSRVVPGDARDDRAVGSS